MKIVLIWIVAMVVLIVGGSFSYIQYQKYFGVKIADVNREVTLHARSFTKGMRDDILYYMLEYRNSDSIGKKSIESVVRQECSEFDENTLPVEMQDFVKKCKYGN